MGERIETALWIALRALEERADLLRRPSLRNTDRGHRALGARYRDQADDAIEQAAVIRRALHETDLTQPKAQGASPA